MHFWHILILNYGNTQRTLLFIYLFLVQSPHFQAPLNLVPANPTGQEELSIVTTKSPNVMVVTSMARLIKYTRLEESTINGVATTAILFASKSFREPLSSMKIGM